jgi:hypothetical protein
MGLKWDSSEDTPITDAATANSASAAEYADALNKRIQSVADAIDSGELKGAAYEAAKSLFVQYFLPIGKALKNIADDFHEDAADYASIRTIMNGTTHIDEDAVQEQIDNNKASITAQSLKKQDSSVSTQQPLLPQNSPLLPDNIISDLQSDNKTLTEQLQKLHDFNSKTSNLFSTFESNLGTLKAAIDDINSAKLNSSTGEFTFSDNSAQDWEDNLAALAQGNLNTDPTWSTDSVGKPEIIEDLETSYGLDPQTAGLLYKLQRAIIAKAKEDGKDANWVIYEYNRIIASCTGKGGDGASGYVSTRWKATSGTMEDADLLALFKQYGLTESDAEYVRDDVRAKHRTGPTQKDYAHEAVQIAEFTKQSFFMNPIAGLSDLVNRAGFTGESYEDEEISFKGDVDSGRYSNTDFNSDLDAINQYSRAQFQDPEDVFKTAAQYNHEVQEKSANRVDEFYKNYGNGDSTKGKKEIKRILEIPTPGSDFISGGDTPEHQKSMQAFNQYLNQGEKK